MRVAAQAGRSGSKLGLAALADPGFAGLGRLGDREDGLTRPVVLGGCIRERTAPHRSETACSLPMNIAPRGDRHVREDLAAAPRRNEEIGADVAQRRHSASVGGRDQAAGKPRLATLEVDVLDRILRAEREDLVQVRSINRFALATI